MRLRTAAAPLRSAGAGGGPTAAPQPMGGRRSGRAGAGARATVALPPRAAGAYVPMAAGGPRRPLRRPPPRAAPGPAAAQEAAPQVSGAAPPPQGRPRASPLRQPPRPPGVGPAGPQGLLAGSAPGARRRGRRGPAGAVRAEGGSGVCRSVASRARVRCGVLPWGSPPSGRPSWGWGRPLCPLRAPHRVVGLAVGSQEICPCRAPAWRGSGWGRAGCTLPPGPAVSCVAGCGSCCCRVTLCPRPRVFVCDAEMTVDYRCSRSVCWQTHPLVCSPSALGG